MRKRAGRYQGWMPVFVVACASACWAQAGPEDAQIDTIRTLSNIGGSDERRINTWLSGKIDKLTQDARSDPNGAFQSYAQFLVTQYNHSKNTPIFKTTLAEQASVVMAPRFGQPNLDGWVAGTMARTLFAFKRVETEPALLAGLESNSQVARLYCARALASLRSSFAADKAAVDRVVAALKSTASSESNAVVLGTMYRALAYTGQHQASAVDAYVAVFDSRLAARRAGAVRVDRAELSAFEFFRSSAVQGGLSANQKAKLVAALAVFLRMDAQRYNVAKLEFDEIDTIERRLDAAEEVISNLVGSGVRGGDVRGALSTGGHAASSAVLAEADKWVGDPKSKSTGALNAAPWNVPSGAP